MAFVCLSCKHFSTATQRCLESIYKCSGINSTHFTMHIIICSSFILYKEQSIPAERMHAYCSVYKSTLIIFNSFPWYQIRNIYRGKQKGLEIEEGKNNTKEKHQKERNQRRTNNAIPIPVLLLCKDSYIYLYTLLPLYTLVVCPTKNGAFPFKIKDKI